MDFYPRWQLEPLKKALTKRRVLLISGPRQCGKTTLAKRLNIKGLQYRTLDNPAAKELAELDPLGFIRHSGTTLVIDEIQRVPALLASIKMVVDENNQPGQYLLTGSANIQSLPSVQESLAGRISKLRLRPIAQGELLGAQPRFLEQAFNQTFKLDNDHALNRRALLELAFRGGYPEAIRLTGKDRGGWHRDYLRAILERDLHDIARIQRQSAIEELVTILAAWSGKYMDIGRICTGLEISRPTLESYINALATIYIVEKVPPWTRTDYERVGKHSKIFMSDSGLMASILRWNIDQIEMDPDRSGKLIESFIFNEISAQIDANRDEYKLYQYRDREQREIDFLIEREDDLALLGIEVKAGSTISKNDFKHLEWFQKNLVKDKKFVGIVLYAGEIVGSMGNNLWAVPFHMLWS